MTLFYIIAGIVILFVFWIVFAYNSLITSRNRVDEGWSDIDVQLKRRHSLIPNLVATVKGYAAHERGVFEEVTKARTQAISANTPKEHIAAENMLTGALKSLFAVAESYPQLKANENFGKLQDDLTDTEDKIQAARRFYNSQVRDYNTKIQQAPTNIIAGWFHFTSREFFDLDETPEVREDIKVNF